MSEVGIISLGYRLLSDLWGLVRGKKRRLSESEIIQLRKKWKEEFETKLLERRRDGLTTDVIIRDMKRIDKYPESDEKDKGISPWFKVGLMSTYHKGILTGLRWGNLKLDGENYRFRDYVNKEQGDIKVILIGYIPYENIEHVDWDGDEYEGHPHIYCYFDATKKEPYEKLAFCKENYHNEFPFYTEVAEFNDVRKRSKKLKIDDFA